MPSMTIRITDYTAAAQNLDTLAHQGSQTGYTVVRSDTGGTLPAVSAIDFLSIQASYSNGGTLVYVGGSNVKNDGTCQARELFAGDTDQRQRGFQPIGNLSQWFIRANANSAIINVEYE